MLDTKVFYAPSRFSYSASPLVRTTYRQDRVNCAKWAMRTEPIQLRQCAVVRGVEYELEAMFATAFGPRKDLDELKQLVDCNMLAQSTAKLLLRAAANADDPANLLRFAIALRQLDDLHVPVVHTLDLLIGQGRKISLRWSADQWWKAFAAASFLYAGLDSKTPRPRPSATRPMSPEDSRIIAVDTPDRLSREAYRQRSSKILAYADQIANGTMRCASVLMEGKRWTVIYFPDQFGRRDRVTSYIGAAGAKPPRSVRRRISDLVA